MKKYFLRFLLILSILLTFNSFASVTIVPVNIEINKDNRIAAMTE